jgi:diaminohydroxyphosphoribosylaminopyrimidine deaminase / 5-amino-6-(5-phosphoribosylamino)uracil reductase
MSGWCLPPGVGTGGPIALTLPTLTSRATDAPSNPDDEYWMGEALKVALRGVGRANPNPAVGCVIVKDGVRIAEGATEGYGGRHAERCALAAISGREHVQGATLYVTLEPCSHTGRQPPCAVVVGASGIKRCVIAVRDPNPLVDGAGIAQLRAAGIVVDIGVRADEAAAWHAPFLVRHLRPGRPVLAAKWAQTLDGQLIYQDGTSQWITGPEARAHGHWLRQRYDAIMVGAATVLADRPALTVRDCNTPQHHPVRVIFDPRGHLVSTQGDVVDWPNLLIFDGTALTVVLLGEAAAREVGEWRERRLWADRRVLLVPLPPFTSDRGLIETALDRLQSHALAERLTRPITSVLVEGGPRLLSLCADTVGFDLYHVFVAPKLGGSAFGRLSLPAPRGPAMELAQLSSNRIGDDILIELLRPDLLQPLHRLGAPIGAQLLDPIWHIDAVRALNPTN